jgi:hypothetical protein
MDLIKTYVLCVKQPEKTLSIENYNCNYYKSLEEVKKCEKNENENEKDVHIFEIYGPKQFHNDQVNHYLAFYCKNQTN